jgi:prepilin-type N-terminal cleavage/methylation domain-containing protein
MNIGKTVEHGRPRRGERGQVAVGRTRRGSQRRSGFTLIELMLVVSVLLIAFLALSQSLVASMALTRVNRESALATDALRQTVEVLQGVEDFGSVFRLYNDDPGDDPGPGPAPGAGFAVAGLEPVEGDPDGQVGEIVFPSVDTGAGLELREGLDLPEFGMPRDLNGDGDAQDVLGPYDEYRLLPVLVRLRWRGASGERTAEIRTLLADR